VSGFRAVTAQPILYGRIKAVPDLYGKAV